MIGKTLNKTLDFTINTINKSTVKHELIFMINRDVLITLSSGSAKNLFQR